MIGALKLGVVAGVAYTMGGRAGTAIATAVKPDLSVEGLTGAAWAGRIATFFVGVAIVSRI